MPFEGHVLNACGLLVIDLSDIEVIAVSGSGPNACGHLMLHAKAHGGYLFHVAGVNAHPRYMAASEYARYLKENRKQELTRVRVVLANPAGAAAYLEQSLSSTWLWGVLPHNCVAFCEAVIRAGGGSWSSYSNCPAIATDVPQHEIDRILSGLQAELLNQVRAK